MSDLIDNDNELDRILVSHYKNLSLRDSKLEAFVAMSAITENEITLSEARIEKLLVNWSRSWKSGFAIAASLLVLVFSVLQYTLPSRIDSVELSQLVSKEIALNHNKGLMPEFNSIDYAALASAMDKLDFSPVQPDEVDVSGLQLIGARYCSIHGQLAAQLKLKDSKGNLVTLYQTQLNPELNQLPQTSYQVNGVDVQQWQEAGLFFGLAKSVL